MLGLRAAPYVKIARAGNAGLAGSGQNSPRPMADDLSRGVRGRDRSAGLTAGPGQRHTPPSSVRPTLGASPIRWPGHLSSAIRDRAQSQSVERGLNQPIGGRKRPGTSPSARGRTSAIARLARGMTKDDHERRSECADRGAKSARTILGAAADWRAHAPAGRSQLAHCAASNPAPSLDGPRAARRHLSCGLKTEFALGRDRHADQLPTLGFSSVR